MTPKELVAKCNALARLYYSQQGYQVEEGYRFDQAAHPQERGMWNLAATAFYFIEGTDMDDVLGELDDND